MADTTSADTSSREQLSICKLILVPAIITLGITLIRLVGELQNWPSPLFGKAAGGGGSIVGITWLAPVFGVYFALKLVRAGRAPASVARAIGMAVLGALIIVGTSMAAVKTTAAMNLPRTTSVKDTGIVRSISYEPMCNSSEKRRIVMAGTIKANTKGSMVKKFLMSAWL